MRRPEEQQRAVPGEAQEKHNPLWWRRSDSSNTGGPGGGRRTGPTGAAAGSQLAGGVPSSRTCPHSAACQWSERRTGSDRIVGGAGRRATRVGGAVSHCPAGSEVRGHQARPEHITQISCYGQVEKGR